MMLDGYPPIVSLQDFLATCENVFLIIFCVEMCIMRHVSKEFALALKP
ncbi:unnamed protein product [Symbiodinium microadriaticum]|nr:unnamed protein product [Symbiodinium microadriaticum]